MAFIAPQTPIASVTLTGDRLVIEGSVCFENANVVYQTGQRLLGNTTQSALTIDLAGLSQSHTVLLAVIVQWIRSLKAHQELHLANVPAKMRAIIEASRLQEIL